MRLDRASSAAVPDAADVGVELPDSSGGKRAAQEGGAAAVEPHFEDIPILDPQSAISSTFLSFSFPSASIPLAFQK